MNVMKAYVGVELHSSGSLLISVLGDNKWSAPWIGKRAPGNIEWECKRVLEPDCKLEEENLLPPTGTHYSSSVISP